MPSARITCGGDRTFTSRPYALCHQLSNGADVIIAKAPQMHTQAPSGPRKPQNPTVAARSSAVPAKLFLTCWCASSNACLAVIRPVAALANIVGRTKVSNTSLSAGFAGPGCPMLVAHCKAVLIGLSLEGGFEPNGSFAVTCSSHLLPEAIFCATGAPGSATEPVKDGKLYSLLPRTASR